MASLVSEHEEPIWFRTLACLSPLLVLGVVRGVMGGPSVDRLRLSGFLVVLGICMLSAILSALLLGHAVFRKRGGRRAFKAAVLLLCVGWTWQLGCYFLLVPAGGIPAGYFETSEGSLIGHMLVLIPVITVSVGLSITLTLGLWSSWRVGFRLALLALIGWWLVAWLVFLLPDIPLSLQGYGVFI
jgi:hypothetical protein